MLILLIKFALKLFTLKINIDLSVSMKNILVKVSLNDNYMQCLYHLIKNPTNLSRLEWKNIPKSSNAMMLYGENKPCWLMNVDLYLQLSHDLMKELSLIVNNIYQSYNTLPIIKEINKLNYHTAKSDIRNNKMLLQDQLTLIYIELFNELNDLFDDINIIRWKNHIDLYRKLPTSYAINCITNIFSFYVDILVVKNKLLSENPIWLLIIELIRTHNYF